MYSHWNLKNAGSTTKWHGVKLHLIQLNQILLITHFRKTAYFITKPPGEFINQDTSVVLLASGIRY